MYILERICDIAWLAVILTLSFVMGKRLLRSVKVEYSYGIAML